MKIEQYTTNAQNAHNSRNSHSTNGVNRSNECKKRDNRKETKMSKLNRKQFRKTLEASGTLDKNAIDVIIANGIASGTVTSASRGKIDVLRSNFPEFNEICEHLEVFEATMKDEINECMDREGFPRVSKMSVNVAK